MVLTTEQLAHLVQSTCVEIIVIPDADDCNTYTTFTLPEGLLKTQSKWFETKLAERWLSDDSGGKVRIVDFTVEAFQIFIHWLYREALPTMSGAESLRHGRSPVSYLLQAWLLFDYFNMPAQQNAVMGLMCTTTARTQAELVDEADLVLARCSGKKQLVDFALQALTISLVDELSDWNRLHGLSQDRAFVQEVWSVLVELLKKANVKFPLVQRSGIAEWDMGVSTLQFRVEDRSED